MLTTLYSFFSETLGFPQLETRLLVWCPAFACFGGLVHAYSLLSDYSKLPKKGAIAPANVALGRAGWMAGRMLLSFAAGLVFALYLVGALTESPTTTARILGFSVLLGYAAPKLWASQERILMKVVEDRLPRILEGYFGPRSQPVERSETEPNRVPETDR